MLYILLNMTARSFRQNDYKYISCLDDKHLMFGVMNQEVERLIPLRIGGAFKQLQRDDEKIR